MNRRYFMKSVVGLLSVYGVSGLQQLSAFNSTFPIAPMAKRELVIVYRFWMMHEDKLPEQYLADMKQVSFISTRDQQLAEGKLMNVHGLYLAKIEVAMIALLGSHFV